MPPPSHQQIIDAPLSLGGFFPAESDEEEEETELDPCYEIQTVDVAGNSLQIRQYAYHSHNANRVWPGTFNLAEYLLQQNEDDGKTYIHHWKSVLELGTATGLLAIRLSQSRSNSNSSSSSDNCCCTSIVTSDVDDEHGDVAENVAFNFPLNDIEQPPHVPHTWGTGWPIDRYPPNDFDTIVASDILLYVSAYPALVQTLEELMPPDSRTKLIMSWNRRMKESLEFFDRMKEAGFECEHLGKCVYRLERRMTQTTTTTAPAEAVAASS
jgi:predicted nicotinamide N-methyase